MTDPPPRTDEARDERHLAQLREALAGGDPFAIRAAQGRLLEPYWNYSYAIVFRSISGVRNREAEAEDLAEEVLLRLVRALGNRQEFGKAFWKVALDNIRWVLSD